MMKLGNASWGFRETALEEQLKITSDMGLNLLELGIANAPKDIPLDAANDDLDNVKALFEKYNVKLLCAATGNDFTTGSYDDVDKIKRVIDICQYLGVKYLRIFAGFSPVSEVVGERWNIMIDSLNKVSTYGKEKNVVCVVETHGGVNAFDDGVEHFASTTTEISKIKEILNQVPDCMINFDPSNLWAVGNKNPEKFYEEIKDRVCYVHLKDFAPLASGHILPASCGESEMDWKKIVDALKDFDGPALFEYENTDDVKDGCERCLNYISKLL